MVVLLNASPFSQTALRATSLTFQISCPAVSSQKRRSFFLFSISGQNGTVSSAGAWRTSHLTRRGGVRWQPTGAAQRHLSLHFQPPAPRGEPRRGPAEPGPAPRGCSPGLNASCASPSGLRVWSPGALPRGCGGPRPPRGTSRGRGAGAQGRGGCLEARVGPARAGPWGLTPRQRRGRLGAGQEPALQYLVNAAASEKSSPAARDFLLPIRSSPALVTGGGCPARSAAGS